jgi:hypothetical protein
MVKVKLCGIYKIEHISGYYYIGMSIDIFSRWSAHYTSIKLMNHTSNEFVSLFLSSMIEDWTFSILEYISSRDLKLQSKLKGKDFENYLRRYLLKRERFWMSKYSINYSLNKDKKYFS